MLLHPSSETHFLRLLHMSLPASRPVASLPLLAHHQLQTVHMAGPVHVVPHDLTPSPSFAPEERTWAA